MTVLFIIMPVKHMQNHNLQYVSRQSYNLCFETQWKILTHF